MMQIEEERLAYIDNLIANIEEHLIERRIQQEWETLEEMCKWGVENQQSFN